MSRYEWERGEIVIPANQWSQFKKSFREAHNKALKSDLELVANAIAQVKTTHKGKRNVRWASVLREELERVIPRARSYSYSLFDGPGSDYAYSLKILDVYHIVDRVVLCTEQLNADGSKIVRERLGPIKKKDLPLATNKTVVFDRPFSTISFIDKKHTVIWQVDEGNHACDRAEADYLAGVLFGLLDKVQWKRNSGGCLVGNDELNEEDNSLGGGQNYLKMKFGPIGEKMADQDTRRVSRRPRH